MFKLPSLKTDVNFFSHLTVKDQMFFAKTLATLTGAGLPLEKALIGIRNQTTSKPLRKILLTILVDIAGGEFLSTSLHKFPKDFSTLFISLVKIGEKTGTLTESLTQVASHLEKTRELIGKIRAALLYPIIIGMGTLATAGYLILVLLPQLLPLFKSLNVDLPWTTRVVLGTSAFVQDTKWLLLFALCALGALCVFLLHLPQTKEPIQRTLLRLPVVGPIIANVHLTQTANIIGTLHKAGITIVDALKIAAQTSTNLVYQRDLLAMAVSIEDGGTIAQYLSRHRTHFPAIATQMIGVGEDSGKLDESWIFVSTYAERELDDATKALTTILEPLLLLFVGAFVGFIAISIITPIYQLTGGIQH